MVTQKNYFPFYVCQEGQFFCNISIYDVQLHTLETNEN